VAAGRRSAPSKLVAYERELLFLYIEEPQTRARLREFFTQAEWTDAASGPLAACLLEMDETLVPAEMLSLITAREPEAASVLAAARLSHTEDISSLRLAEALIASLREGQLQRRIRAANAQLRQMAPGSPDYDALYERIAAFQRELSQQKKSIKRATIRTDTKGTTPHQ
jgi:hypothetical protein